jgi:hypothetical protein
MNRSLHTYHIGSFLFPHRRIRKIWKGKRYTYHVYEPIIRDFVPSLLAPDIGEVDIKNSADMKGSLFSFRMIYNTEEPVYDNP